MKIKKIVFNNRKKAFEVSTASGVLEFPFSRLTLRPTESDPIAEAYVDSEIGNEGFTYRLASGKEDTIHVDQVLEYNRDPDYLRGILLHKLTLLARRLIKERGVSKREVTRRLMSSPTQLYRLLDPTFKGKTLDQMVRLLAALDAPVDFVVQRRTVHGRARRAA